MYSKMDPLSLAALCWPRELHNRFWAPQSYLADVMNLRSLICWRFVGVLSPFTVGLCRITSHEVFSLKTFSFMVIYYCFISNVHATRCFSKDQFFRAVAAEGALHLWNCSEFWSQERGIMNHWPEFWWWVAKKHLCRRGPHLWFSH